MGGSIGLTLGLTRCGSGWTPARLTDLRAWSECDRTVYQDASMTNPAGPGDPVGGVPDLSGAGAHGQQTTQALKPTLTAAAFPSGRAGLTFDGVDDRLILAGLGASLSGADVPFTVGVACKVTDGGNRAVQGLGNSATSTPYSMLYSNGVSVVHYRRDDASASASLTGPALSVNQVRIVVASFGESPGVIARTSVNAASEQSGAMDVGATTLDRFVIGGTERSGAVLYPFKGLIGAWVVVARAISASERLAIASYLMAWAGV